MTPLNDATALALLELTPMPARFLVAEQRFSKPSTYRARVVELWFDLTPENITGMVEHEWRKVAPEAHASDPERFGLAMIRLLREAAGTASPSDALNSVAADWLSREPERVATVLDGLAQQGTIWWGLRQLPLRPEIREQMVLWARKHPEHAFIVAQFSSGADQLALQLLEELRPNKLVERVLSSRAGTYGGWGPMSSLTHQRIAQLRALSQRARSTRAKRWFAAQLRSLEQAESDMRQEEAAYDAGALPLPNVADSRE